MKALITVLTIAAMLPVSAELNKHSLSNTSWDVTMTHNGSAYTESTCLIFHTSGKFSAANQTLTMQWRADPANPKMFIAVTAPGERSVVPYQSGLHGMLSDDHTIRGTGIDQNGNVYEFGGKPVKQCTDVFSGNSAKSVDPAISALTWQGDQLNNVKLPATVARPVPDPGTLVMTNVTIGLADKGTDLAASGSDALTWQGSQLNNTKRPATAARPVPDPGTLMMTDVTIGLADKGADLAASSSDALTWQGDQLTHAQRSLMLAGRFIPDLTALVADVLATLFDYCSVSWCDPILDPLRDSPPDPATTMFTQLLTAIAPKTVRAWGGGVRRSALEGRLYRVVLINTAGYARQVCWYFGLDRAIDMGDGSYLVWEGDSLMNPSTEGFRSVGVNPQGHGVAYQGALINDHMFYVHGIQAFNGSASAVRGYGEAVVMCAARNAYK